MANNSTTKVKKFTVDQVQKLTTLAFDIGKKAGSMTSKKAGLDKVGKGRAGTYLVPIKVVGKGVVHMGLDIFIGLEQVKISRKLIKKSEKLKIQFLAILS